MVRSSRHAGPLLRKIQAKSKIFHVDENFGGQTERTPIGNNRRGEGRKRSAIMVLPSASALSKRQESVLLWFILALRAGMVVCVTAKNFQ